MDVSWRALERFEMYLIIYNEIKEFIAGPVINNIMQTRLQDNHSTRA